MGQTLRRKGLHSWLILIFLQTAASQSTVMYMMSVSPTTTRSEMHTAASSTPTMTVSNQTRRPETTTSTEEKTTEPTTFVCRPSELNSPASWSLIVAEPMLAEFITKKIYYDPTNTILVCCIA
ncbi:uncharacterized protein LOC141872103 isoform X1 [Acropora palmata]|uniref:uncharacterized protein LOC141872103 isoform X1 n=1 Tax=Acropora palmata TaxID=6131 RepID=UPI003DA0DDC3